MKRKHKITAILLFVLLITDPLSVLSQGKIEITPFGGYMFGGKMRFYEGDFKIYDAGNYGLAIDIELANDTKLELFWSQMNTTAQFKPYYGFDYLGREAFDINVGYIQIGGVREIDMDNIRPFGVMTVGTTYFKPQSKAGEYQYSDDWRFSVSLGGGAKIWFTDRVGIRLQGRLLLPMFWGGAGFTFGTGGSGISVGASTSMVQGDFTGGLIIGLGD
jgi:hypothetical protein